MIIREEEWRPRGIGELEPAAWKALKAGNASVTAGPGAGKSEFLAQRASYLLETGLCPHPQQILAISFKKSSASNLEQRVATRVPELAQRLTSITFDAFTKMLLDRFNQLLPRPWRLRDGYRIDYPSRRDVDDFLHDVRASAPPQFKDGVQALQNNTFLSELVGRTALDADLGDPTTAEAYAVREWWNFRYLNSATAALDFVLINRLVELMVRSSSMLHRALTLTYPFVFVDEFQDTTYAQYSLLRTVFADAGTTVTVVGDANQRIMGWAGAHNNAFAEFSSDFRADSIQLRDNHRSSAELIELQHQIATLVAPTARKQVAKAVREAGDTSAQIWAFTTPHREANAIARWIADDMREHGRAPGDYALIARQKVAAMEGMLSSAFEKVGLKIRNDDAEYNGVRLQDLLKYDLSELLIDLLRMAASSGGNPYAWQRTISTLSKLCQEDSAEAKDLAERALSDFLETLRIWLADHQMPETLDERREIVSGLLDVLLDFIGFERAANSRFLAESEDEAIFILKAIGLRLIDVMDPARGWLAAVDAFGDADGVSLLTIHRSKGLEYHTVFFLALDDNQWWSHESNPVESTMAFYVGVTRAMERIIFTYSEERGDRKKVNGFYDRLESAGVPIFRMDG